MGDVLFSDVVLASATVAATRSRLAKVDTLAGALRAADLATEVPAVVGFLIGQPRQGRIGTGWRTLVKLDVPPADGGGVGICLSGRGHLGGRMLVLLLLRDADQRPVLGASEL